MREIMFLLKDILLPKKMKILFFVKISAFMLLLWICYLCSELRLNNNILNKTYMDNDALGIRIERLLARRELGNKNFHDNLQNKASDYRDNRKMKYESDDVKLYNQLGKNNLSKYELYRKDYKKRYNKKDVIAKLECYCENKLFDKFDYICNLKEKMKNDKKMYKKKIFKIYLLPLIIISLFSLLVTIMPILDYFKLFHFTSFCEKVSGNNKEDHITCQNVEEMFLNLNLEFFVLVNIILVSGCIYTLVKMLKYKRMKARRTMK